jgi:hypothetical protein
VVVPSVGGARSVFFAREYPILGCGNFWFSFDHALDIFYELVSSSNGANSDSMAIANTQATTAKLFLLRKNKGNKEGIRLYFYCMQRPTTMPLIHGTAYSLC